MSRIREEAQHLPLKEAVSRALVATGTTVTSAGLVLGGTLRFSPSWAPRQQLAQFRYVGAGLALGVLMGHVPAPDPAGAVDGRAARPVELVAVRDEQARRWPPQHPG